MRPVLRRSHGRLPGGVAVGRRKAGVARAELLALTGLALIVLAAVVPSVMAARQRQRVARVREDFKALSLATQQYFREYLTLPSAHIGKGSDTRYGASIPNQELVGILRGQPTAGIPEVELNPNRVEFLFVPARKEGWSGLDESGQFLDPWGTPYQVVLDTDLDGSCEVANSIHGRHAGKELLVWSCGPDRRSDTPDDICSWRE